jgi:DUF1365 family protein
MHARLAPRTHRFSYRLFFFAFDLDELEALARRLRLFSLGRLGLYSFFDRDYLPVDETCPRPDGPLATGIREGAGLKARVVAFLAAHGIDHPGGRVVLVTLPRMLGFLFNPVSFYHCFDAAGRPIAVIAEVTNTFREIKPYMLGPETRIPAGAGADAAPPTFRSRQTKRFYVSPFSDVDVQFEFLLRTPGTGLHARIDDYAGEVRTLTSTVIGNRRDLTDARLAWFAVKYPLLTLRVITLIHWQAAKLWLKRVPWYRKAARAAEQTGLYRTHGSTPVSPTPRATVAETPHRPAPASP